MLRRLLPLVLSLACSSFAASSAADPSPIQIPGLTERVRVSLDDDGVTHIAARNDLDLARAQGFVHARDRFFQMDVMRRQAEGTLAELLGDSALQPDITSRTLGLARAAARTLEVLSEREQALLQAYADGVNAFLASHPIPLEYALLEITQVRGWEPVDSLTVLKSVLALLSLTLDLDATVRLDRFVRAGAEKGFDGEALYFRDLVRTAPIVPATTLPDAGAPSPFSDAREGLDPASLASVGAQAEELQRRLEAVPFLSHVMRRRQLGIGSNGFAISSERSRSRRPLIANDPHLLLDAPATFYEWRLEVTDDPELGPMNASGVSFPGFLGVSLGQNDHLAWGATVNPLDVSDVFLDRLVVDPAGVCAPVAAQACILTEGEPKPVQIEQASYRINVVGDGALDNVVPAAVPAALSVIATVPFRSFGPVLSISDPSVLTTGGETQAMVLQYTGFHATREVTTLLALSRARDVDAFQAALEHFDFGSLNWLVADTQGNLLYTTSAESPLRADLESGRVAGLPPFFVRDGSGPANWVADPQRRQGQAIPFAVLPMSEMPQVKNPPAGFFVNANNDPAGVTLDNDALDQRRRSNPQAIYYLSSLYADGLRAGRITQELRRSFSRGRRVSFSDLQELQADTRQLDAQLLTPHLLRAFDRARRRGAAPALAELADDREVREAIRRLERWDFSSPTGIPDGFDASDRDGERRDRVPRDEIDASVATTIYNVWRAKVIQAVVDATSKRVGVPTINGFDGLKATLHLLEQEPFTGVGSSGVDFFAGELPGAADRRDRLLLQALRDALDTLASEAFAPAFGGSRDPRDYRWGKLHRIVFEHPFAPELSVPPAQGFANLSDALPGLARDGAFETVNASSFDPRADRPSEFVFGLGPARRYVAEVAPRSRLFSRLGFLIGFLSGFDPGSGVRAVSRLPGGPSGDPLSPRYVTQLGAWLTADYHEVRTRTPLIGLTRDELFVPVEADALPEPANASPPDR